LSHRIPASNKVDRAEAGNGQRCKERGGLGWFSLMRHWRKLELLCQANWKGQSSSFDLRREAGSEDVVKREERAEGGLV